MMALLLSRYQHETELTAPLAARLATRVALGLDLVDRRPRTAASLHKLEHVVVEELLLVRPAEAAHTGQVAGVHRSHRVALQVDIGC
jgi:hypothetical protein